ncbi:MAG: NAD-dependent epimerase/dehydratase family protein [Prevotella sp.]|nr:NAD-dependent epimerase/dehydratase family protein [Prevotella sp.]
MSKFLDDIQRIYDFPLPWEQLSGSNILVTGATGLIGSSLVDVLMHHPQRDYQVYAAGRNEERAKNRFQDYQDDSSFHFLKYDVMESLTSEIPFHYIIHAASNGSPNFFANHPVEVMKANLFGVTNLIEYGMSHDMRRFLYVSSGEVYGECADDVFSEKSSGYVDCANPRACYPSSKRAAETLCVSYAKEYGADVVVARPCHTYGPCFTESDNRAYAQFIRNVQQGQDIVLRSPGTQLRSWCYVVDCANALLHILMKGASSEAYNIADETSNLTIRQLAELIAKIGGRKVVMDIDENLMKTNNIISHALFDTSKLKALGWRPIADVEHNVRVTVEVQKS